MDAPEFHLTKDVDFAYKIFDKVMQEYGHIPLSELPDEPLPKTGCLWFFTIAKQEGITVPWFTKAFKRCKKKTHVKRAEGCVEHHASGKLHAHMIVEMVKPHSLAEIKRVFNFEKNYKKDMQMPAYKIVPFDKWEKILPYIHKEDFFIIN